MSELKEWGWLLALMISSASLYFSRSDKGKDAREKERAELRRLIELSFAKLDAATEALNVHKLEAHKTFATRHELGAVRGEVIASFSAIQQDLTTYGQRLAREEGRRGHE